MSGGYFDYSQYRIETIADEIESIMAENDAAGWYNFSNETIALFKDAVRVLRRAYVYAHRIDWLVSGDDGEESFRDRLIEELEEIEETK